MHRDIAGDIAARVKILPLFRRYLQEGYYPLYREVSSQFAQRLSAIVANVLEVDVPAVMDVTPSTVRKIKKMLMILAESCPQTPNMSTLYRELETDRNAGIRMPEARSFCISLKSAYRTNSITQINAKISTAVVTHPASPLGSTAMMLSSSATEAAASSSGVSMEMVLRSKRLEKKAKNAMIARIEEKRAALGI